MNPFRTLRTSVLMFLTSAAVCLAQDDLPLDRPTPQETQRAAVGMLFTMIGGLLVVVLLLRWISRKQPPPPKPTDDSPFAKAEDFFSKQGR